MTSATTVPAGIGLEAWVSFLRAHSAITRALNADLLNEHGLTLNDYEVLLHLSRADDGITRRLDGLERAGFVEKRACKSDARVSYAKLTDAGADKLATAAKTHLAGVEELFAGRFSGPESETLAELLGRLPMTGRDCAGAAADSCGPS